MSCDCTICEGADLVLEIRRFIAQTWPDFWHAWKTTDMVVNFERQKYLLLGIPTEASAVNA